MSRIEELIEKLCPEGVEYRELGEVCEFKNGFAFKSSSFKDNGLPILRITNILSNGYIDTENFVYFDANEYKEDLQSFVVDAEDIVVAMSGATTGKIGINKTGKKLYLNQRVGKFIPNKSHLHNKYLYHWLLSQSVNIYNASSGVGAQPNLSSEKMKQFRIPIPPLEVQNEIVKVLDNFSELTAELAAELTAELTARKQQYEYYREKLFKFDESVKVVKLGDIAKFSQGIQVDVKQQLPEKKDGYVQFLRIVDFVTDNEPPRYIERPNDRYMKEENEMIMIRYGASSAGKVFISKSGAIANNMFKINFTLENYDIKYMYYFLSQKKVYEFLNHTGSGSTMPAINFGMVSNIDIPIPPIEKQKQIVEILDNFSKLCEDISDGLPAEIEARQKQYEYYRDKLLTFEKLS